MILSIVILLVLLVFSEASTQGAINGLRLCANAVIPSLLPFFVVSRLLPQIRCRGIAKLLCLSEATSGALLVSFLGGYPIGIARICSMYDEGYIEKNEAQQAIVICNNSGPGFFIGMIGSCVLFDVSLGIILYLIHVLSALVCVYVFRPKSKSYAIKRNPTDIGFAQRFSNAVSASCEAMLNVCALVVLFSILMSVMNTLPIKLPASLEALFFGALELTSGICASGGNFVLCSYLMGWGGLCVHLQAMSLWKKQGLTVKGYLAAKLTHGLVSAIFAAAYLRGALIFSLCIIIFIVLCVILRNFIKNGVEKKEIMLYNTCER